MSDDKLLLMLEVVTRKLGANDARVEIGGRPPESEHELWAPVGHGHRRLVARFEAPPSDRPQMQERLTLLADTFVDIAESTLPHDHTLDEATGSHAAGALDDELVGLCARTGARAAVVIDNSSPVVWGASHGELGGTGAVERMERVAAALERASSVELDEGVARMRVRGGADAALLERVVHDLGDAEARHRYSLAARAVRAVRERLSKAPSLTGSLRQLKRDGELWLYARGLGGVYALVLAFDGAFSEPQVDGAVRRTLHHLERLIASLPPIDPPPGGRMRVIPLRRT